MSSFSVFCVKIDFLFLSRFSFILEPEVLKTILVKDFSNFRNHHIPGKQPARFRRSIFAARDDYWKRIRSVLTPSFSAGKMKLMVPLIQKSCDVLLEKLESIANTGERIHEFLNLDRVC